MTITIIDLRSCVYAEKCVHMCLDIAKPCHDI